MATKKQPATKKSTVVKKSSGATKTTKRRVSAEMLYKERNPERHQATGKYKFFYIMFACTTLFFAALSVWLFAFASETQNKYEAVDACVRAHTSCNVRLEDNKYSVEE